MSIVGSDYNAVELLKCRSSCASVQLEPKILTTDCPPINLAATTGMSRNPSIILITKLPIRNEAILVSYTRASNGARSGHGGRADSKMHDRRLGRLCRCS